MLKYNNGKWLNYQNNYFFGQIDIRNKRELRERESKREREREKDREKEREKVRKRVRDRERERVRNRYNL